MVDRPKTSLDSDPTLKEKTPGEATGILVRRRATIGRYRVERSIGTGGMGVVFVAMDPKLHRRVAVKLMHEHLLGDPKNRVRMMREAQALAQLSHPHVVQIYEVGEDGEQLFIAMEYVDGGTLREWVEARPRHWSEIVRVYAQAALGLAAAHDVGLTHRDFKPENTLLGRDGRVRVVDFGLAQIQRDVDRPSGSETTPEGWLAEDAFEMHATVTGGLVGTAAYMPPEQLRGQTVDARCDVFAFCVALYRALYGHNPFHGTTLARLYQEITNEQIRAPPEATEVPRWLFELVAHGLAADPARRYPSMHALLGELDRRGGLTAPLAAAMGPPVTSASSRALGDAGYRFDDVVRQRDGMWWWTGRHEVSNHGVLARILPEPRTHPEAAGRLREEFEALRSFHDPRIAEVDRWLPFEDGLALVVRTHERKVLRDLLEQTGLLPPRRGLEIALGVARALGAVHARGRQHGRLAPEYVLVAPGDGEVALFGLLAEDASAPSTLLVDVASDLRDFGELGRALLGAMPEDDVSRTGLRAIVDKLLAPHLDDRYVSLRGVRMDLEACLERLDAAAHGPPRVLGTHDARYDLDIPEALWGRAAELDRLRAAYLRVVAGATEVALVSGRSGVGKTALVHALRDDVAQRGGRFVAGKFDPVGSEVPYVSLAAALGQGLVGLAHLDPDARAWWARRLEDALGDNVGVLAPVIPELAAWVGEPKPVPRLPPAEAAQRFEDSCRALVAALAAPGHPLVVFLDDLQWSDRATLKLLATLLPPPASGHVLLIGTFRDDEVDDDHPLRTTIRQWEAHGRSVAWIDVAPLDHETVAEMIAPVLERSATEVAGLAFTLHAKTGGNPLFVWEQLRALLQQRILSFDGARECWTWDPAELTDAALGHDVLELMSAAMQRLPPATRDALAVAACVGNVFDLATVAHTLEIEPDATAEALALASTRGVVEPLRGLDDAPGIYRFTHDRMQQAAFALLSDAVAARTHARIGRWLLERTRPDPRDDVLFAIANHLNAGLRAITSEAERHEILHLDVRAGRRAKLSNAYAEAAGYFRQARALLPADPWTPAWAETAFEIYRELMECEYLNQDVEASRALLGELLAHAPSALQRAEVYALKATLESSNGHHARAIEAAAAGLRVLGMRIPTRGSTLAVLWDLVAVRRRLRGRAIAELADLPRVEDPTIDVMMKLLIAYGTAGYFVDPRLMSVGMMRITRLTLRHGTTDVSSFGFAGYAMVLSGVLGHYERATELGQLALALNERYANATLESKLGVLNGMFLVPWTRPFEQARALLERAFVSGIRNGDLAYTSYSGATHSTLHFLQGVSLDETSAMTAAKLPVVKRTLASDMASIVLTVHRMSLCFRGLTDAPPSFASDDWDEYAFVASLDDARTPLASYYYRLAKLITKVHFHDLQDADALVEEIRDRLDAAFGNPTRVDFYFFETLWAAAVFPTSRPTKRWKLRRRMQANLKRMARWARSSPDNYEARHLLMRAEVERCIGGRNADPVRLYDLALWSARKSGAPHLEGLAFELAAAYSDARGHQIAVRRYAEGALEAYQRWKAAAKVAYLERRYPFLSGSQSFTPEDRY